MVELVNTKNHKIIRHLKTLFPSKCVMNQIEQFKRKLREAHSVGQVTYIYQTTAGLKD
jgi:hypothetical protein